MVMPSTLHGRHLLKPMRRTRTGNGASNLPWWEQLADDFRRHAGNAGVEERHRLQVTSVAALERFARWPLATAVASAMAASLARPAQPGGSQRE